AVHAGRRESEHLVPPDCVLGHPRERAADVVPDARSGMGEGRHVDDDPHAGRWYTNESKCAPSRRTSVLPSMRFAGMRVGETRKSTTHVPSTAVRGTRSITPAVGGTEIRAAGRPPTSA